MKTIKGILPLALAATACIDGASEKRTDTNSVRSTPVVSAVRVNQGTYGMTSKVKWQLSPDSSGILAMVDPAGVEAEAVPNGFFFGSESKNFQTRMDSAWDVAPSPDWNTIAFSRAYVLNPRESDTIPPAMWQDVARRTGMDSATVRTGSFASSGMSMQRAIAQPGTISIPVDGRATGTTDASAPRMYPVAIGWRVSWTADGKFVALGNSPARVQDDQPSETWASLDPKSGEFHTTLPSGANPVASKWISGPVLEMSVPVDMQGAPSISVVSGGRTLSIESARGVISARETGGGANPASRSFPIGSGKALAATRGGRYILALAPRANAVAHEVPVEVVVYVVGW